MDITLLKKGLWFLLAFSLALNIGFVITVSTQKGPGPMDFARKAPPPWPGISVLEQMDLPPDVRSKVIEAIHRLVDAHGKMITQIWLEEDKLLGLIGRPGPLDKNSLEKNSREIIQILDRNIRDKAEHIIEIRNLIGPEKSEQFFSKVREQFKQGMMRERH